MDGQEDDMASPRGVGLTTVLVVYTVASLFGCGLLRRGVGTARPTTKESSSEMTDSKRQKSAAASHPLSQRKCIVPWTAPHLDR